MGLFSRSKRVWLVLSKSDDKDKKGITWQVEQRQISKEARELAGKKIEAGAKRVVVYVGRKEYCLRSEKGTGE